MRKTRVWARKKLESFFNQPRLSESDPTFWIVNGIVGLRAAACAQDWKSHPIASRSAMKRIRQGTQSQVEQKHTVSAVQSLFSSSHSSLGRAAASHLLLLLDF